MPLTEKGEKIKAAMVSKYGSEKGEEVFYASKNKGTISGVDDEHLNNHPGKDIKPDDNQHMGFTSGQAVEIKHLSEACDALSSRIDAFEKRKSQMQPQKVKPKIKDNMQPSNVHPKEPGGL
jgi:hypothetical protein